MVLTLGPIRWPITFPRNLAQDFTHSISEGRASLKACHFSAEFVNRGNLTRGACHRTAIHLVRGMGDSDNGFAANLRD